MSNIEDFLSKKGTIVFIILLAFFAIMLYGLIHFSEAKLQRREKLYKLNQIFIEKEHYCCQILPKSFRNISKNK